MSIYERERERASLEIFYELLMSLSLRSEDIFLCSPKIDRSFSDLSEHQTMFVSFFFILSTCQLIMFLSRSWPWNNINSIDSQKTLVHCFSDYFIACCFVYSSRLGRFFFSQWVWIRQPNIDTSIELSSSTSHCQRSRLLDQLHKFCFIHRQ